MSYPFACLCLCLSYKYCEHERVNDSSKSQGPTHKCYAKSRLPLKVGSLETWYGTLFLMPCFCSCLDTVLLVKSLAGPAPCWKFLEPRDHLPPEYLPYVSCSLIVDSTPSIVLSFPTDAVNTSLTMQ